MPVALSGKLQTVAEGPPRREPPPTHTGCAGEAYILGALAVIFGAKSPDWRSCLGESLAGQSPECCLSLDVPSPRAMFPHVPEECNSARLGNRLGPSLLQRAKAQKEQQCHLS